MSWQWIEGSRGFDLAWGLGTAALCLALAVPLLWWWLPAHARSFFGEAIDPRRRLQLGYGLFCMALAGTNLGCRTIPHDGLPLVHPAFFAMTLVLAAALAPRIVSLALRGGSLGR